MVVLRYPGSKNSFRDALDTHLPDDVTAVASPFFGGGAYEFHLAQRMDVVAADLNTALVNFWNMTHEKPGAVADTVEQIGERMNKEKFHGLREQLMQTTDTDLLLSDTTNCRVPAAAAFFVINRTSYNGIMRYYAPNAGRFTSSCVNKLRNFVWPERLNRLEQCDAFDFLEKHTEKFWFLDPPYYGVKAGLYGLNAEKHVFDHLRLADFLQQHTTCRWMMTYDNHPDVWNMYKQFADIQEIDVHYSCRHTNKRELVIKSRATIK